MKPSQLFDRWFVQSIVKLKELPTGDGAFVALMIALPLYERYITAKLKLAEIETSDDNVRQETANDLDLNDHQRRIFRATFRVGFMHQAMAQKMATQNGWSATNLVNFLNSRKSMASIISCSILGNLWIVFSHNTKTMLN